MDSEYLRAINKRTWFLKGNIGTYSLQNVARLQTVVKNHVSKTTSLTDTDLFFVTTGTCKKSDSLDF